MASEDDVCGWNELLLSSTKLLEQAVPSSPFPPLQRNLDQLEALSKKLKAKTLRSEASSQSISATRLLAREGINADQLTRDLRSFELKTRLEDEVPAKATNIEEYLQQVHEMAIASAIQEAQKDNLRSFNDYMMKVMEEDWNNGKRDFLQSLSRISSLPKINKSDMSSVGMHPGEPAYASASAPEVSSVTSGMELVTPVKKPPLETKFSAYAEVVRKLNHARERGLPFKTASAFKAAYETLALETSSRKSVNMQKIWHLTQALVGENSIVPQNLSRTMRLVVGARRHLECGHEKYIMDTIQSHPAQAALGGSVGNLQRIHAFLRIRLRDYGVLDFDVGDPRRQPPFDTTWQQIYFCLRTGYFDEARNVAQSSRASQQFAPLLAEWISSGGMIHAEVAVAASEECEKMLRMIDVAGRVSCDKKKLLLYALVSASRRQIDHLLRDLPTLFNTIEDFLWFKLSAVRDPHPPGRSSTVALHEGHAPYSLEDLQAYLNNFDPPHYTKNGKDPLVYPYVLFLSIQFLPAISYLSKEAADEGYGVDAVHISIVLADCGVLSEGTGVGKKIGVLDAHAEVSGLIRQYGAGFSRHGDLTTTLEYFAQAAAAVGGGEASWSGRAAVDQQRKRSLLLKQLLSELLLRDGGVFLLLGPRGAGEEGELVRFLPDFSSRQKFLLEAAHQQQQAGFYDKSVEILKRVGAFSLALDATNRCLSEAICALSHGRLDSESRVAGLIQSGNEILETNKYYPDASVQERELALEQETVLRQLEGVLSVHRLAKLGRHADALREVTKLPFLPLDPRVADGASNVLQNDALSVHVQACVPDLVKIALTCLDNVTDPDGSLRAIRAKIAMFLANNLNQNWPRDLYDKVAQSL